MGDNTDLTVRALMQRDEPRWRELWRAYLAFYHTTLDDAVYRSTFARLVSPDGPQWGLIAEVAGRPVGLVHYLFHRHNWKLEDVCYLQDLYADPAQRGRGIGRALIEAVYAAADANGTPSVYWLTQQSNTTARRLYDRIGEATEFIKYQRGLRK